MKGNEVATRQVTFRVYDRQISYLIGKAASETLRLGRKVTLADVCREAIDSMERAEARPEAVETEAEEAQS